MQRKSLRSLLSACLLLVSGGAGALPSLWLYGGYGPQPGEESQSNAIAGLDWLPYHFARSGHQWLSLGVSAARLSAHGISGQQQLYALSLFPQLTLYAQSGGDYQPFFQVRALGPTYLSQTSLGSRRQASHFALQAQVMAGVHFGQRHQHSLALAYRHYSNANLDSPNDGMDVPLVLNLGFTF